MLIEQFAAKGIQTRAMLSPKPAFFRTLTVVVTLLAWLAISNHCALAALHFSKSEKVCNHCHDESKNSADQKAPQHATVCCKVLKAVEGKALWQPNTGVTGGIDYIITASEWSILPKVIPASAMPTGPPGLVSIIVCNLQRCHRVNAPPFLG